MKNKNTKVVPIAPDGMPIEVATEMLTTPKVKMTARLRKTCFAAREKVYSSVAPIRKVFRPEDARIEDRKIELQYGESRLPVEIKLSRRVHQLKFCQLVSHCRRVPRRIAKLRSLYLKLMNSDAPESIKQMQGAQLTQTVANLEKVLSTLQAEINLRHKIVAR